MRKTYRLLILSATVFSLISCNTNSTSKKSKKSTSEPGSTSLTSESTSTPQSSSSSSSSTSVTPTGDSLFIGTTGATLPSKLYGGSGESGGVALDDSANRTEFVNYINDIAGYNLVDSFNPVNKVYFNTNGNVGKENVQLTLGTGNYEGKMTMNLNVAVTKIEIVYSAYYKVTATGTPYDEGAVLYIEDRQYNPEITTTLPEPKQTVTYEYATPSKTVYLTNDNGDAVADGQHRVFIYSIKLFF